MISFGMNAVHIVAFIVVDGTVRGLWWRIFGKKEQERQPWDAEKRRGPSDIAEMRRDFVASIEPNGEKGRA